MAGRNRIPEENERSGKTLRTSFGDVDVPDAFSRRWDKKRPGISRFWRENLANLSACFKFPQAVRRLIYTSNAIAGFNRQLRKVSKAKSVFRTDDSLLKMLYLAMRDIPRK